MSITGTEEYQAIRRYYWNKIAKRSQLPLINHIHEGIHLLEFWGRPEIEKRAFCLHPLVQNGEMEICPVTDAAPLAMEYAQKANTYLCKPENDWIDDETVLQDILGPMSTGCVWMLLADKVQNQKDFRTYHWFDHDRRRELEAYFNLWIMTLRTYYLGE